MQCKIGDGASTRDAESVAGTVHGVVKRPLPGPRS